MSTAEIEDARARIGALEDMRDALLVKIEALDAVNDTLRQIIGLGEAEHERMRVAWRSAMNHPGIIVSADGDDAASVWNALCALMD